MRSVGGGKAAPGAAAGSAVAGEEEGDEHDSPRAGEESGDVDECGAPVPVVRAGCDCAPALPPDVEECYNLAVAAEKTNYKDPLTGYQCFTEAGLRTRGTCCGNRCRHCPFGHFKVTRKGPRVNRVTAPALLVADSYTPMAPQVAMLAVAAGQADAAAARLDDLIASGGGNGSVVVLVVLDAASRSMWAPSAAQDSSAPDSSVDALSAVMDVCVKRRVSMVAVPLSAATARKCGVSLPQWVMQQAATLLGVDHVVQSVAWASSPASGLPWLPAKLQASGGVSGSWSDLLPPS